MSEANPYGRLWKRRKQLQGCRYALPRATSRRHGGGPGCRQPKTVHIEEGQQWDPVERFMVEGKQLHDNGGAHPEQGRGVAGPERDRTKVVDLTAETKEAGHGQEQRR